MTFLDIYNSWITTVILLIVGFAVITFGTPPTPTDSKKKKSQK
jgi:putative Mn2+ efflux pump MntP